MTISREEWLTSAAELIMIELLSPICEVRDNLTLKLSVGYAPNTRTSSKTIGCCLSSACSEAGHNEIFISPTINDSIEVLATLVHEIIHAIDDVRDGHGGRFALIARKVGLEGKLTATVAGEALKRQLQDYADMMGDIPHDLVDLSSRPKQATRNLKVLCACGFHFRTSVSQISSVVDQVGLIPCPACASPMQYPDYQLHNERT